MELNKICYSLVTWKLKNIREDCSSLKDEPGTVHWRSDKYTGLNVELRKNYVNDAERQPWARLALDGGDEAEYSYRLDQAKALAGKVASSPFSMHDTEVI